MRLIVGCGYLGQRVANLWVNQGLSVAAITRNPARAANWVEMGIRPIIADVTDPQSLKGIEELGPLEGIFHAVGLDRHSGKSMEEVYIGGLNNVLAATRKQPSGKFLFISSSSVYTQDDGNWVDESSLPNATQGSGKVVLDAEKTLRKTRPDAVVLRFAGIYGPGRLLRRPMIEKGEPIPVDPEKWLNLIHVEDGARLVDLAWNRAGPGADYAISDGNPVNRGDYYRTLARLLNAPEPRFTSGEMGQRGGPDSAHRRICSQKAKTDLAWTPVYPDHESGLRAILSEKPS